MVALCSFRFWDQKTAVFLVKSRLVLYLALHEGAERQVVLVNAVVALRAVWIGPVDRLGAGRHRSLSFLNPAVETSCGGGKHRCTERDGLISRRDRDFEVHDVRHGLHHEAALLGDSADGDRTIN